MRFDGVGMISPLLALIASDSGPRAKGDMLGLRPIIKCKG